MERYRRQAMIMRNVLTNSPRELKWVRRAFLDLFIVNAKEEFVHFFRK